MSMFHATQMYPTDRSRCLRKESRRPEAASLRELLNNSFKMARRGLVSEFQVVGLLPGFGSRALRFGDAEEAGAGGGVAGGALCTARAVRNARIVYLHINGSGRPGLRQWRRSRANRSCSASRAPWTGSPPRWPRSVEPTRSSSSP